MQDAIEIMQLKPIPCNIGILKINNMRSMNFMVRKCITLGNRTDKMLYRTIFFISSPLQKLILLVLFRSPYIGFSLKNKQKYSYMYITINYTPYWLCSTAPILGVENNRIWEMAKKS